MDDFVPFISEYEEQGYLLRLIPVDNKLQVWRRNKIDDRPWEDNPLAVFQLEDDQLYPILIKWRVVRAIFSCLLVKDPDMYDEETQRADMESMNATGALFDWIDANLQEWKEEAKKEVKKEKSSPDLIEVGDIVTVCFDDNPAETDVEVLHVPCATGDSWRFKRKSGTLVYTNSFAKIMRFVESEGVLARR